jgi:hypothetical protein
VTTLAPIVRPEDLTAAADHSAGDEMGLRARRYVRLALVLCLAAHVWLISAGHLGFWPQFTARYDLLARGFALGQTNLPIITNPKFAALPDPYDPVANKIFRKKPGVPDSCFYRGKFYIYWGPAPAILLMPIKAILGQNEMIGDQYVCFAFTQGLLIATALLLLRIRSRHFPDASPWLPSLGVLLMGFTAPITCIMTRSAVYEAAIVGGQFFLLLGIYFTWRGISSLRDSAGTFSPIACLFAAGTCLSLAVGCRISLAIAVTAIGLLAVGAMLRQLRQNPKRTIAAMLSLTIPLVSAAMGLAWYNMTRFGSWTDFGQKYQLANVNLRSYPTLFGIDCLAPGLWSYFCRPMAIVPHFPFFLAVKGDGTFPDWITLPQNYESYEPITGLIFVMPILAMIPIAGLALLRRRPISTGNGLRWLVASLLLSAILGFLPVLLMIGSSQRYLVDLTPPLIIVTMIAIWWMTDRTRVSPKTARRTLAFAVPMVLISICVGFLVSIEGYGAHFRYFNPELFEKLSGHHIPVQLETSTDPAATNTN